MNTATTKQWYLLYTRRKSEKKVADLLEKRKIEVYCPQNKSSRSLSDRKKNQEALFDSCVFVYADETEHTRIRETDGVINFVHWLNKPAIIRQEEIDTIRKFLTEYDNVSLEKSAVNLAEKVKIINGPLMMWEGNIVEIRTSTVKILLPSLGYTLVAEIHSQKAEPVHPIRELNKKAV